MLGLVLACGLGSLALGQDDNTDLHRYRFYIGYAFVHGRLDRDLAPAALGTYLNPALDAIDYLGMTRLPPRVFGFLLGALHGLNPALVFLLARRLLLRLREAFGLALLAAVLAATGPSAKSLLGTTLGDTTASIPVLLALFLVVLHVTEWQSRAWLLPAAGVLAGVAVGLKLTTLPYLIALTGVVTIMVLGKSARVRDAAAFAGGATLGFLAVAGYWCWQMWRHFENPLFPLANHIFKSPYLPPEAIRDLRWAAHGLSDYLSPPLLMALGATSRLQEIPFRDSRFLLVAIAGLAWMALRLARKRAALAPAESLLLFYALTAYLIWLAAFYYYRYAVVLEYLAPLLLVILVRALVPRHAVRLLWIAGIVVLLSTSVGSWQRYEWGERWWRVQLPPQAYVPDTLVLLDSPLSSFLIPYFPEQATFAGLEWSGSSRLEALLATRIAAHRGAFMVLSRLSQADDPGLGRFRLEATNDCGIVRTGYGKWSLCRARRSR